MATFVVWLVSLHSFRDVHERVVVSRSGAHAVWCTLRARICAKSALLDKSTTPPSGGWLQSAESLGLALSMPPPGHPPTGPPFISDAHPLHCRTRLNDWLPASLFGWPWNTQSSTEARAHLPLSLVNPLSLSLSLSPSSTLPECVQLVPSVCPALPVMVRLPLWRASTPLWTPQAMHWQLAFACIAGAGWVLSILPATPQTFNCPLNAFLGTRRLSCLTQIARAYVGTTLKWLLYQVFKRQAYCLWHRTYWISRTDRGILFQIGTFQFFSHLRVPCLQASLSLYVYLPTSTRTGRRTVKSENKAHTLVSVFTQSLFAATRWRPIHLAGCGGHRLCILRKFCVGLPSNAPELLFPSRVGSLKWISHSTAAHRRMCTSANKTTN